MIPAVGRIVLYKLNPHDVKAINRRRGDATAAGRRTDGAVVHTGNPVSEGDVFPAVIVRCWGDTEGSMVNLHVLLDGNDTYWAMSRSEGDDGGHWAPTGLEGWS